MPQKESELEIKQRAERIQLAIAKLSQKKAEIEASGEEAREGAYIARYQALRQKNRYWYYQLKARATQF